MVTRGARLTGEYILRIVADVSRYNPAARISQQNRQIQQSARQTAAASQQAGVMTQRQMAAQQRLAAQQNQVVQAGIRYQRWQAQKNFQARLDEIAAGGVYQRVGRNFYGGGYRHGPPIPPTPQTGGGGNWFTTPGQFSSRRRGAITALPSGPGAIAGTAFGRTAGALADIGVVGGLLPEGLGAGAAAGAVGIIGAGLAISAFTSATIKASREMGTIESLRLGRAMFQLRRETTLLFAELGTVVLPIVQSLVEGLTGFVRVLRWLNILGEEEVLKQGRGTLQAGYTPQGMPTFFDVARAQEGRGGTQILEALGIARGDGPKMPRLIGLDLAQMIRHPVESVVVKKVLPVAGAQIVKELERSVDTENAEGFWEKYIKQMSNPFGFQHGGIVHPRQGGVLARVAEGGQAEAILPMRQLASLMTAVRGGAMPAPGGYGAQERLADDFQAALRHSQDLPPLWQLLEEDEAAEAAAAAAPVEVTVTPTGAAAPLNFVTGPEYTALTDKTGFYAIYGPDATGPPRVTLSASPTPIQFGSQVTLVATPSNPPVGVQYRFQKRIGSNFWQPLNTELQTAATYRYTESGTVSINIQYRVLMYDGDGIPAGNPSAPQQIAWVAAAPATPTIALQASDDTVDAHNTLRLTATIANRIDPTWVEFQSRAGTTGAWVNLNASDNPPRIQAVGNIVRDTTSSATAGIRQYRAVMYDASTGGAQRGQPSAHDQVQWNAGSALSVTLTTPATNREVEDDITITAVLPSSGLPPGRVLQFQWRDVGDTEWSDLGDRQTGATKQFHETTSGLRDYRVLVYRSQGSNTLVMPASNIQTINWYDPDD